MAQQRLLLVQHCQSSRCTEVVCAQGATIAGWVRGTRVAIAAALAAAVTTAALAFEPTGPAACRGKTANEPLAPNHRVSTVAGVLRNAVWEKDPRCRDLATLLQHLKTAGYDGTETGCGDLIMCFYQDKSPEEAIPIIREEFRRAGMQPLGANYLVTDEPRAADGTTSNTYPRGNVRTKSDRNLPLSLCCAMLLAGDPAVLRSNGEAACRQLTVDPGTKARVPQFLLRASQAADEVLDGIITFKTRTG